MLALILQASTKTLGPILVHGTTGLSCVHDPKYICSCLVLFLPDAFHIEIFLSISGHSITITCYLLTSIVQAEPLELM